MNTCAVLSALSRHDIALNHAQQAITILQTKILFDFLPNQKEEGDLVAIATRKERKKKLEEAKRKKAEQLNRDGEVNRQEENILNAMEGIDPNKT